jgi:hypothetical protein
MDEEAFWNVKGRTKNFAVPNGKIPLVFDDYLRRENSPDTFYDCYFQWLDTWQLETTGARGVTPNLYEASAQEDFENLLAAIDSFDVLEYYENVHNC